ncbi:MAG: cadmium-translocating P-type ATPase [Chthoniobacterales bacterium]|nr:cadmium-translocating P-type ATPase [Chthoniobacterales bacterium]
MADCCHGKAGTAPREAPPGTPYTCPMHPEVVRDGPGDCPKCGMALEPMGVPVEDADRHELHTLVVRLAVCGALSVPVVAMGMGHLAHGTAWGHWSGGTASRWLQALLTTPVLFWGGWPFLRRAWQSLVHRSANMFTLIAAGTLAAWGFSMAVMLHPAWFGSSGVYFESTAVIITLVLAGQVMELHARRRTGNALRALMDLAPATAWQILPDAPVREVTLDRVQPGDLLRVFPGGKVPVDGVATAGESAVDESMLTGESLPVGVRPGSKVRAGTINGAGSFDLRAEAVGSGTVLAQIVDMVAQAQRGRAPVQDLADRVAAVFVPAVIGCAVLAFIAWMVAAGSAPAAVTAAVSVLIIACPCAIGLAVPMSVMVGVGRAARSGVLVRNPSALERLEKTDTLCLDKTGTLTCGRPEVVRVARAPGADEERVWSVAAALESRSEHPLGAAIVRSARERGLELPEAAEFTSTAGGGVSGVVAGMAVRAGTPDFARVSGEAPADDSGRSRVDVSEDGRWLGTFFLEDAAKPSAHAVLDELRGLGLRIVMLTGDREPVARRVAGELGITEFHAGMSPADKAAVVRSMQAEGRRVCMAGDGVNDAPALAEAETGIAMGTGSDVAKETADFILVHGSLEGILRTFMLGRAIMRNIRQNLFLAFAYNTLGIPLAAGVLYPFTGWLLNPMIAGLAMSLSSVSVIGNALRLGRQRA